MYAATLSRDIRGLCTRLHLSRRRRRTSCVSEVGRRGIRDPLRLAAERTFITEPDLRVPSVLRCRCGCSPSLRPLLRGSARFRRFGVWRGSDRSLPPASPPSRRSASLLFRVVLLLASLSGARLFVTPLPGIDHAESAESTSSRTQRLRVPTAAFGSRVRVIGSPRLAGCSKGTWEGYLSGSFSVWALDELRGCFNPARCSDGTETRRSPCLGSRGRTSVEQVGGHGEEEFRVGYVPFACFDPVLRVRQGAAP